LTELLEDHLGLGELAVAQAGLGHLGLQAVVVFLGSQGEGLAVAHQRGQPIVGQGQPVALDLQLGWIGRFQVFLVLLVAGGLLLGQKLLGLVLGEAAHGSGGTAGGAAAGNG
jgi:hypothetical protein